MHDTYIFSPLGQTLSLAYLDPFIQRKKKCLIDDLIE